MVPVRACGILSVDQMSPRTNRDVSHAQQDTAGRGLEYSPLAFWAAVLHPLVVYGHGYPSVLSVLRWIT